jgi:hypothetical protein
MVLGLLSAVAACPAIIGTTEAVRQGQKSNAREKHRGRKVNLVIRLPNKNEYSPRFDESLIVLKDGKVSAGGINESGFTHALLESRSGRQTGRRYCMAG